MKHNSSSLISAGERPRTNESKMPKKYAGKGGSPFTDKKTANMHHISNMSGKFASSGTDYGGQGFAQVTVFDNNA